jgi:ketosteroid isomerase-like protein
MTVEEQIRNLVELETRAWDAQDAEALVDLFHPDMVWPWPPSADSHDPSGWVFPQGRFNRERWKNGWNQLFAEHELVHNRRTTVRVVASAEGDGGFAVVDVDTLWKHRKTGEPFHWKGRACKGYTLVGGEWRLIFHTGLLDYSPDGMPGARPVESDPSRSSEE